MTEPPSTSQGWSWQAKALLVSWIGLVTATPVLLFLMPYWFDWAQQQGLPGKLLRLPFWLLVAAWVAGAVGSVVWFFNKRRSDRLAGIAQDLKLDLTPAPEDDDWASMRDFAFFRIGFDQSARNWMTGKLGHYDIAILDYFFRRSGLPRDIEIRRSSRDYHQTVVAFWNASAKLPGFQLVTRESWWSHMGAKNRSPKGCIGDLKIGKAMNRDFFKNYLVGGPSEASLREFFSPLLMEYFCAHKGWDVESTDGHLLIYQETRLQPPAKMAEFLEQARQIAETLRERAEGAGWQ